MAEPAYLRFFSWFGRLGEFTGAVFKSLAALPGEMPELVRQMDEIGSRSLPLVGAGGAAIGAVLTLHTQDTLTRFGAQSLIPSLIVFSMVQESGPLIASLMVAGRVGAGIGAELGSMKATDQIDALEVSGIDPMRLLVGTRVLALVLMLPILTVIADAAGILTGFLLNPMPLERFISEGFRYIRLEDFIPNTLRTTILGFIIGIISCHEGLNVTHGTAGVGRATTRSVVLSMFLVILADVVLVKLIYMVFD